MGGMMVDVQKGELLHEGKGKRVHSVLGDRDLCWVEFKDALTAFNAQKTGSFAGKGRLNCEIATQIFQHLQASNVLTHWVSELSPTEMLVEKLQIVPLEVVMRNFLAGSTAKKFGLSEGRPLQRPLLEFFYKSDELGDPFINDEQALMMGAVAHQKDLEKIKQEAYKVNDILQDLFRRAGIELVDFKMEFGWNSRGDLLLGDEISPDSCRLWDQKTGKKLDKDRFRKDLGGVKEGYQEVKDRLQTVREAL